MAQLSLTFSDVYNEVADILSLGSDATSVTISKDLTYRGYRRALMGVGSSGAHKWSFLKKLHTIATSNGEWQYQLPLDYRCLTVGPKQFSGEGTDDPEASDLSKILALRNTSVLTGTPTYYTIVPGRYTEDFKQIHEIWFWKTPGSTSLLYLMQYAFEPIKPEADADLFVGPIEFHELVLQCALAAGEASEDETVGVQEQKAVQMMETAILFDQTYGINPIDEYDPEQFIQPPVGPPIQAGGV